MGIIQDQDGDADCTFIQRGQVPTFKGANVHPLMKVRYDFLCREKNPCHEAYVRTRSNMYFLSRFA